MEQRRIVRLAVFVTPSDYTALHEAADRLKLPPNYSDSDIMNYVLQQFDRGLFDFETKVLKILDEMKKKDELISNLQESLTAQKVENQNLRNRYVTAI